MRPSRLMMFAGMSAMAQVLGGFYATAGILSAAEAGDGPVDYAVSANGRFAVDLYKRLSRENEGENLFFSPYSITSALMMTAEGARGETAAEMGEALRFPAALRRAGDEAAEKPWDLAPLHRGFAELNDRFNAPNLPYELKVANALWGEQSHPFLQSYIDAVQKYYKTGGLFAVDFLHHAEQAGVRINRWVERQTNEKIKNLIPKGQLDSLTRLVLTNAIYFKAKWRDIFKEHSTRPADFFLSADRKTKVPMMFQKEKHRYAEDDSLQALELAYEGEQLSMLVFLPRKVDGLPRLEQTLSWRTIEAWRAKLRPREVRTYLPKFKLEMSFQLKRPLEALGMKRAFGGGADLSGIDGQRFLAISAVIHKTFIDLDEAGTEAAAATAVVAAGAAPPRPGSPPPVFRADHPFLFAICDNRSGCVLFLGRVTKPEGYSADSTRKYPVPSSTTAPID